MLYAYHPAHYIPEITPPVQLVGDTTGTSTSDGTLRSITPITSIGIGGAGDSTTTGTPTRIHRFTGSTTGTSSTSGATIRVRPATGATIGASSTSGPAHRVRPLTGGTTGGSVTGATLRRARPLAGTSGSASDTFGFLIRHGPSPHSPPLHAGTVTQHRGPHAGTPVPA